MAKALGMVEYFNVTTGVQAADIMAKTADVEIIEAMTVCPGKYIVIISGELSAVKASVEASKERFPQKLVDSFVLGNPHEDIFPAIYASTDPGEVSALGVLETFSVASAIVAADIAAKTAIVKLIELRLAKGMSGKSYLFLTGEVAAVTAAIEKARESIKDEGMYLDSAVIPRPDKNLWKSIL